MCHVPGQQKVLICSFYVLMQHAECFSSVGVASNGYAVYSILRVKLVFAGLLGASPHSGCFAYSNL